MIDRLWIRKNFVWTNFSDPKYFSPIFGQYIRIRFKLNFYQSFDPILVLPFLQTKDLSSHWLTPLLEKHQLDLGFYVIDIQSYYQKNFFIKILKLGKFQELLPWLEAIVQRKIKFPKIVGFFLNTVQFFRKSPTKKKQKDWFCIYCKVFWFISPFQCFSKRSEIPYFPS